jgi:hypothetical protein
MSFHIDRFTQQEEPPGVWQWSCILLHENPRRVGDDYVARIEHDGANSKVMWFGGTEDIAMNKAMFDDWIRANCKGHWIEPLLSAYEDITILGVQMLIDYVDSPGPRQLSGDELHKLLSGIPSSPVVGQIWIDGSTSEIRIYDGADWVTT